ncbi:MAG: hypothetical protein ABS921_07060 [Psychrobacter alimentarius]
MTSLSTLCKKQSKKTAAISATLLFTVFALSAVSGCTTTQEFKPTASVMVGAHKSL